MNCGTIADSHLLPEPSDAISPLSGAAPFAAEIQSNPPAFAIRADPRRQSTPEPTWLLLMETVWIVVCVAIESAIALGLAVGLIWKLLA